MSAAAFDESLQHVSSFMTGFLVHELLSYHDIDQTLERFEACWRNGSRPQIGDYLPPESAVMEGDPSVGRLLVELVMIDLECCWRSDRVSNSTANDETLALDLASPIGGPLLEHYVAQHRWLGGINDLPLRLIADEYRVRFRWGDRPSHESYLERFQQHPQKEIIAALNGVDKQLPQVADPIFQLPMEFGNYTLIEEVARGGMGIVYRATQKDLGRVVAVKVIRSGRFASNTELSRFQKEAKTAARLDHPNIVSIHEVGKCSGLHYLSMNFVEGETLAEQLVIGPTPVELAAQLVHEIADAVSYAHGQHVVHRDLKPANVIVDAQGNPKITDFGLAKHVDSDKGLTASGEILGTPGFMPPEQAAGNTQYVGPAADIYSLGAILYNLVTGRPPFSAATPVETVLQVLQQDPVPPRKLNSQLPRDIETICLKCLQKDPQRRYATAEDLKTDLNCFLSGLPIKARPVHIGTHLWRWSKRNRMVASLSIASALLACCLVVGAVVGLLMLEAEHNEKLAQYEMLRISSAKLLRANNALKAESARREKEYREKLKAFEEAAAAEALAEREKDRANSQRARAEAANERAKIAEEQADAERMNKSFAEYQKQITSAKAALNSGNQQSVATILSSCRKEFRGWEWAYLWKAAQNFDVDAKPTLNSLVDIISLPTLINAVAISTQGRHLAAVGDDGYLRVYAPKSGALQLSEKISEQPLSSVTFDTASNLIAAAGSDSFIYLRSLDGKTTVELPSGRNGATTLALYRSFLLTGSADGTVSCRERSGQIRFSKPYPLFSVGSSVKRIHVVSLPGTPNFKQRKVAVLALGAGGRVALGQLRGTPPLPLKPAPQFAQFLNRPNFSDLFVGMGPGGGFYLKHKREHRISHWSLGLNDKYQPMSQRVLVEEKIDGEKYWVSKVVTRNVYSGTTLDIGPVGNVTYQGDRFSLSPNGSFLVCATNTTADVYDAMSSKRLFGLAPHDGPLSQIEWNRDSKWFVTAGSDKKVRIWNVSHRQQLPEQITAMDYSPTGNHFAAAGIGDHKVRIWNKPGGKLLHSPVFAGPVMDLQFDTQGKQLAVATGDGVLTLRSLDKPHRFKRIKDHEGAVLSIAFRPDGRQLASGGEDCSVRVGPSEYLDSTSAPRQLLWEADDAISTLVYSPNSETLVAGTVAGRIQFLDAKSGTQLQDYECKSGIKSATFSHDGNLLATCHHDSQCRLWNVDDPNPGPIAVLGNQINQVRFSHRGDRIFAANGDGNVDILDVETGQRLLSLAARSGLQCLALHPSGEQLTAAGDAGAMRSWQATLGILDEPISVDHH